MLDEIDALLAEWAVGLLRDPLADAVETKDVSTRFDQRRIIVRIQTDCALRVV
jgi:hypothetical protein